jgi:hypothetical protein
MGGILARSPVDQRGSTFARSLDAPISLSPPASCRIASMAFPSAKKRFRLPTPFRGPAFNA